MRSPVSFLHPSAVDSSVLKNLVSHIQSFGNVARGSFHVSKKCTLVFDMCTKRFTHQFLLLD